MCPDRAGPLLAYEAGGEHEPCANLICKNLPQRGAHTTRQAHLVGSWASTAGWAASRFAASCSCGRGR